MAQLSNPTSIYSQFINKTTAKNNTHCSTQRTRSHKYIEVEALVIISEKFPQIHSPPLRRTYYYSDELRQKEEKSNTVTQRGWERKIHSPTPSAIGWNNELLDRYFLQTSSFFLKKIKISTKINRSRYLQNCKFQQIYHG